MALFPLNGVVARSVGKPLWKPRHVVAAPNVAGGYVAARLCQAVGDRLVANRHTFQKSIFGNGSYLARNVVNHVEGERVRVSLRTVRSSPVCTPRDHHDC